MGRKLAVFSARRDRTAESYIRILLVGQLLYTSSCRTRRPSKQSHRVNDGFGGFWEYLVTRIPKDFRRSARDLLPRRSKPKTEASKRLQDESEPFRESVRHQLFTHMKKSLHVEEYRDYARTPVSGLFDS